jgi:FkbH-like protein
VASKNNPEDVAQVFAEHQDMLLKSEDVAAWAVSWEPKPSNVRKMLKVLNLSGEQAVFVDDSHVERALMRAEMPEITVPELPQDISLWPTFLGNAPWFDNFNLTPEDELRTKRYLEEKKRSEALADVATMSVEDKQSFYSKLQVEVEAFFASPQTVPRLAQMTQRTNQFNFTTQRLTEGELEKLSTDSACEVIGARVRDRYGDYGICGLIILRFGDNAVLENLLVSCRALGRGVEDALRRLVVMRVKARGVNECEIHFIRSTKNSVAEAFLKTCNSNWKEEVADGKQFISFVWSDERDEQESLATAKLIGSMIGD